MRFLFLTSLFLTLSIGQALAAESSTDQVVTIDGEWSVTIDGQIRTWADFEHGTDIAWNAYLAGDYRNSVPVFSRLAELGHPVAEWMMGMVYYKGQGVPKDLGRSIQWFRKSAEQGYFRAYAPLAAMYEKGEGTAVDLGLSYAWYNIAIARLPESRERSDLIELRDRVAAAMTDPQIEAAQKRANEFVPKPVIPPDPEDVELSHPQQ